MPSADQTPKHSSRALGRAIFWPVFLVLLVAFAFYMVQRRSEMRSSVVLITADSTPYWDRVIEGARDAADRYNVDLRIVNADGTMTDQNRKLDEAIALKPDGIAISPVDPARQSATLRDCARNAVLITVDSDSELSDRVCFVGMDNYYAGRSAAELVRAALPDGGTVLIVTGPLDKANGQERRQGIIDALMSRDDRSANDADPVGEPISGPRFTIPATLVDDLDPDEAKAKVAEALADNDEIDAIVGLYGYHAISIADAVSESGVDRDIVVIGFDALPATLEAIGQGRVYGVIAQDQHGYGFHSVRMAAEAAAGYDNAPLSRTLTLPPTLVTAKSLDSIRADLKPGSP